MLQSIEEVGMEKGIDIGVEKGIDIGREEARKETARNLLLLNVLTDEQIAQAASLSIEAVRQLKREKEGGH